MPSASGIQDAAASLTPALVAGAGIMAPAATLGAGAVRAVALNPISQRVLTSPLAEIGTKALARGTRLGAGTQLDDEELQRRMAAQLRGYYK